jgi:hypothetical protein
VTGLQVGGSADNYLVIEHERLSHGTIPSMPGGTLSLAPLPRVVVICYHLGGADGVSAEAQMSSWASVLRLRPWTAQRLGPLSSEHGQPIADKMASAELTSRPVASSNAR